MTNQLQRKQRKINELGTREPKCCICDQEDIFLLATDKIKVTKSILEKHHLLGKHEGDEITVCLNCHARLTDRQLDWPEGTLNKSRTPEMKAVSFIYSLGDIFEYLAELCRKFAKILYDFVVSAQEVES